MLALSKAKMTLEKVENQQSSDQGATRNVMDTTEQATEAGAVAVPNDEITPQIGVKRMRSE